MARRHYVNNAPVVTLATAVDNVAVTMEVTALTGFPVVTPWTAVVDAGKATAEVVLVTGVSGTTVTVTRGYDGSAAQSHQLGATFAHALVAADLDEANDHVNKATGVHGAVGDLVSTDKTQTLKNKTLTTPTINGGTATGVTLDNKVRVPHTFTISGPVLVPSGDTAYVPPFFIPVPTGKAAAVAGVRTRINSGTSVTCSVRQNGSAIAGLGALSVTPTTASVNAGANTLADGDVISLVVSAVAGTPQNMTVTVFVDYPVV